MSTEIRFESDPSGQPSAPNWPISNQVTVTDVATQVAPNRAGRNTVTIKNTDGANSIYVGNEDVTASTGLEIGPDQGITIETEHAVYAICSGGQEAIAGVLEDGPNK